MSEARIRLQIGNVLFEAEGDSEIVRDEREKFLDFMEKHLEPSIINQTEQSDVVALSDKTESFLNARIAEYRSFAEFKRNKTFKSDTDMVMAAAYFLYHYQGLDTFTTNDIKVIMQKSHMKVPANVTQCVNNNIQKGLLEEYQAASSSKSGKILRVLDGADEWVEQFIK